MIGRPGEPHDDKRRMRPLHPDLRSAGGAAPESAQRGDISRVPVGRLFRSLPTRLVALLVALVWLVAACGGSGGASPAATMRHDFPRLEALLPTKFGDVTLVTASAQPDEAQTDARTAALLSRLGKTIGDVQVASAGQTGVDLAIYAMRVVGVDAKQTLAQLRALDAAGGEPAVVDTDATVAGKPMVMRTSGGVVQYMYPISDVLFAVQGSTALVQQAVSQLP
jgi:hypothetical protein